LRNKKELLFVVQQHQAMYLHWDFRLEMDGLLVSWALPDGPSINPKEKRLAFRVEDHDFRYKDFEGIIPGNDYASGKVLIWDRGSYEPQNAGTVCNLHEKWLSTGRLELTLHGTKLKGAWIIYRTAAKLYGEDTWCLCKKADTFSGTVEIVTAAPRSVVSGKTIGEITAADGVFDLNNYR
jgi:bifunctional non-homologous end joining protein LigD